jgi:hypothetical protein
MQRRQSANPWASACRKAMQPPTVRVDVTVAAFAAASNATKRAKAGAFKGAGPCGPRGPRPCVIRGAKSFLSAAGRWLRPVLPRPAHQLSARIRLTRRRPRLGRRPSWTIHPMNGERLQALVARFYALLDALMRQEISRKVDLPFQPLAPSLAHRRDVLPRQRGKRGVLQQPNSARWDRAPSRRAPPVCAAPPSTVACAFLFRPGLRRGVISSSCHR